MPESWRQTMREGLQQALGGSGARESVGQPAGGHSAVFLNTEVGVWENAGGKQSATARGAAGQHPRLASLGLRTPARIVKRAGFAAPSDDQPELPAR